MKGCKLKSMIRKTTDRGTVWILIQKQFTLQDKWKVDAKI